MSSVCLDSKCLISNKDICCTNCKERDTCLYICGFANEKCSYRLETVDNEYNLKLTKEELLYLKVVLKYKRVSSEDDEDAVRKIKSILNKINKVI